MVSYASLVIAFLLFAGPVIVINAIAPGTVDPWNAAALLTAGLFIIWLSIHAHSAFTQYRFAESFKQTDNISFLTEYAVAEATEPYPVTTLRQPEKEATPRPRAATAAHGSAIT